MPAYLQRPTIYTPLPTPATFGHATPLVQSPAIVKPVSRQIWVVTGPAGCGKSSVAAYLAKNLNLPYIEGDDWHPIENVKKMSEGIPLTDDDRWDWLDTLRIKAKEELEAGAMGAVVTCSALKRKYRDFIRQVGQNEANVTVRFVYLRASVELLIQRVKARENHFMKDDMVRSQFVALEEPDSSEPDVVSVDVAGSLTNVQETALQYVQASLMESSYF